MLHAFESVHVFCFLFFQQNAEGLFDLERCIDDFVFLCFLCGNDFLPHLPHQSIQRGSIDALVQLYVHLRPKVVTDYLTQEGRVNLKQLQVFLHHLAIVEKEVIRRDLQRKVSTRKAQREEASGSLPPACLVHTPRCRVFFCAFVQFLSSSRNPGFPEASALPFLLFIFSIPSPSTSQVIAYFLLLKTYIHPSTHPLFLSFCACLSV